MRLPPIKSKARAEGIMEDMHKPDEMCIKCRIELRVWRKYCRKCRNNYLNSFKKLKPKVVKEVEPTEIDKWYTVAMDSYRKLSDKYKEKYYVERTVNLEAIEPYKENIKFNGARTGSYQRRTE